MITDHADVRVRVQCGPFWAWLPGTWPEADDALEWLQSICAPLAQIVEGTRLVCTRRPDGSLLLYPE